HRRTCGTLPRPRDGGAARDSRPDADGALACSRQRDAAAVRGGDHRRHGDDATGRTHAAAGDVPPDHSQGARHPVGGRVMIARTAVLVLVATTALAHAQSTTEVTVDDALALYREHNPRLAATRASVDVTGADLVDAHIYPNPELGISTSATAHGDTAG